jgi:hypothetical protein
MDNEDLIDEITRLMRTDDSAAAPADAVKWSKNLFRARAAAAEPPRSIAEQIRAVLRIDLTPQKTIFGERSASGAARQMLFDAGALKIDLRIARVGRGFKINGQVLGADFAAEEVRLFNAEKSFSVKSNELGEFKFEKISKATYTLSLIFKGKEIITENIEID